MRILFTGGGGAGSEALWKSLNKKYTLFFADAVLDNIDKTIPIGSRVEIPFASSKLYLESIKSVCDENEIDLIVPTVDEELTQFELFLNKDGRISLKYPSSSRISHNIFLLSLLLNDIVFIIKFVLNIIRLKIIR